MFSYRRQVLVSVAQYILEHGPLSYFLRGELNLAGENKALAIGTTAVMSLL